MGIGKSEKGKESCWVLAYSTSEEVTSFVMALKSYDSWNSATESFATVKAHTYREQSLPIPNTLCPSQPSQRRG